jgi:hypothetical protein
MQKSPKVGDPIPSVAPTPQSTTTIFDGALKHDRLWVVAHSPRPLLQPPNNHSKPMYFTLANSLRTLLASHTTSPTLTYSPERQTRLLIASQKLRRWDVCKRPRHWTACHFYKPACAPKISSPKEGDKDMRRGDVKPRPIRFFRNTRGRAVISKRKNLATSEM